MCRGGAMSPLLQHLLAFPADQMLQSGAPPPRRDKTTWRAAGWARQHDMARRPPARQHDMARRPPGATTRHGAPPPGMPQPDLPMTPAWPSPPAATHLRLTGGSPGRLSRRLPLTLGAP
jgi:hypothetical protein